MTKKALCAVNRRLIVCDVLPDKNYAPGEISLAAIQHANKNQPVFAIVQEQIHLGRWRELSRTELPMWGQPYYHVKEIEGDE